MAYNLVHDLIVIVSTVGVLYFWCSRWHIINGIPMSQLTHKARLVPLQRSKLKCYYFLKTYFKNQRLRVFSNTAQHVRNCLVLTINARKQHDNCNNGSAHLQYHQQLVSHPIRLHDAMKSIRYANQVCSQNHIIRFYQ